MEYEIIKNLVYGIREPHLCLEIRTDFDVKKVELYIDGKLSNKKVLVKDSEIVIDTDLPKNVRKIELYIIESGNKVLVFSKNYGYIVRFFKIVSKPFRMLWDFIVRLTRPIIKAIRIAWVRHHFLIPPKLWGRYIKKIFQKLGKDNEYLNPFVEKEYNEWLINQEQNSDEKLDFAFNPLISFIIPVYNIEEKFLSECLDSILQQTYSNFEVCIADDCSTKEETVNTLKKYESLDKRIKVVYRKQNGHISKATNSALEIAAGDYIALMDDDDVITNDALYEIVKLINEDREIDFIYSDEDKMNMDGSLCEPHFKSDFALDSFFGGNYICHFTVLKKSLLDEIGNFNQKYVGAQDFDLFLRATEKAKKIYHIPKILYHWRKVPGSTADTIENKEYAIENGKKAVEAALKRRKLNGYVTVPIKCTQYIVHYNYKKEPLLSVIMLDTTNQSIINNIQVFDKSNYKNIEFIINYSNKLDLKKNNISKIEYINDKNINNLISKSSGEFIMIISGKINTNQIEWIKELVGYSMQKEIGVVAPKLLNYDNTIKSAGLILSNKEIYVNAFANYYCDSTGIYGRLLVPYNYSALASQCIVFERKKYEEVNKFIENVDIEISSIDFCLKMMEKKYRNVLLSHIAVKQQDYKKTLCYEISEKDKQLLREKWNLNDNTYYNKNFSKEFNFMLDKESKNEK